MIWIIAISVSMTYAALAEYAAHRWVMHIPGLGKNEAWRNHAKLHHRAHVEVGIGVSPATTLVMLAPCFLFSFALGWAWAAFLLVYVIVYGWFVTSIHAAIHGYDCRWARTFPLFPIWQRHHLCHHEQPYKNFAALYVFTDFLFGTYAK